MSINDLGLEERLRSLLGLNSYEARVYLAILAGARSPKDISKNSRVPLPRVYDIIERLESYGLVIRDKGSYRVVDPREAIARITFAKIRSVVETAAKARRLAEVLYEKYKAGTSKDVQGVETIRGMEKVFAKSFTIAADSEKVLFSLWKALEKLDYIKPLVEPYLELLRQKEVAIIVAEGTVLSKQDIDLLKKLGVKIYCSKGPVLDMMITEDTVVIGVPDSEVKNEVIAIIVRSSEFASSLRRVILRSSRICY